MVICAKKQGNIVVGPWAPNVQYTYRGNGGQTGHVLLNPVNNEILLGYFDSSFSRLYAERFVNGTYASRVYASSGGQVYTTQGGQQQLAVNTYNGDVWLLSLTGFNQSVRTMVFQQYDASLTTLKNTVSISTHKK